LGNLIGHRNYVNQLSYSPDGRVLLSCSDDKSIKLWAVHSLEVMISLNIGEFAIQSFDMIFEDKLIVFVQED
jgi:WD40 repeat protein